MKEAGLTWDTPGRETVQPQRTRAPLNAEKEERTRPIRSPAPPHIQQNIQLNNLIERGRFEEAEKMFNEIKDKGEANNRIWNLRLKALRSQKKASEFAKAHDEMVKSGIHPDEVSFTTIIHGLISVGDKKGAFAWMDKMKEAGFAPTEMTFGPFLSNLAVDRETLGEVFQKMRQLNVPPEVRTYNRLLSSYSLKGDTKEMQNVWEDMVKAGVKPNPNTFHVLIDTAGRTGNIQEMLNWFEKLKESNIQPTTYTYNRIISRLGGRGSTKDMMKWFEKMVESGVKPNGATFGVMFSTFKRKGDQEGMETVKNLSQQHRVTFREGENMEDASMPEELPK